MRLITFASGEQIKTNLSNNEVIKRRKRLNILIVMTELYEIGDGVSICKKALNAYNKKDNFTGIIRLKNNEKDFLGYRLDSDFISEEEKEIIKFYTK